ncbi:SusC/RagA family TonB-linked outer membrane protein [Gaoshiqia sediminis]|uniref:TonB-dependent receptor n=1 Tax=Gaoshiqia sediminis TaxID=2986998 RepID=A0AA41YD74_9BACT|nr:TonB-dependent receptor [Gaoshiqia sediminis]MCW0484450.1 TonB-dependent receptor [Gaoshiqia sediminis]
MKNAMKSFCFILMVFSSLLSFAQQRTISGTIKSGDGEPLPGATIVVKGTTNGTITDFDGKYQIQANQGDMLIVSFIGFNDASQVVGAESVYDFILEEDTEQLEEVVVTGYAVEKKADITGAISIVKTEDLGQVSTPNVVSKLQSKVPGLTLTSSGVPGGNDTQISIRGLTSVFGGTGPLWVIDGVQTTSPAGLNPNDIESIQVLKDAASAGIYGTEAARGVIIVTTKQAKTGAHKITLDSRVTLNTVRDNFSVLDAQEWLDVRYIAQGNVPVTAGSFTYTPGTPLPEFLDADNNLRLSNTNWIDVILKNSVSTTTDLGYSYGNKRWKVFMGLGYTKDDGLVEYTYYERKNFRLNSSVKLFNDKLTIGENLTVANFQEVKGNSMEDALLQNPLIPLKAEDGTWGGPVGAGLQDKWNPLAILYINRNNTQKTWRTFGNVYADLEIIGELKFSTKFNFDNNRFKFDEQTEAFNQNGSILGNLVYLSNGEEVARYARNRNNTDTYIFTNLLTYSREFGVHSLNAFVGHEVYWKNQDNSYYRIQVPYGTEVDFENVEAYDILADNSNLDAYGIGADSRRESMFAKTSYDYKDKYYLSASIRRDGSSRFGRNNRYAVFPTASIGWTLSNENFLKNNAKVNNLKLRASWGANGNADILEYAQYSIYQQAIENSNYDLNGNGSGEIDLGVSPNQVGNPDLKWEQSYQTNLGLDASLFDSKINLVIDLYEKKTSDLLLQIIQPSVLGEAGKTLFFNAGDMTNKGIDVVVGYKSSPRNKFTYGADLTFSAYENEVTKLNNSDNFILNGVSYTGVGHPIGSYFGYVADGIFRTPEEVAVHAAQPGKALGNIRYRDLNGDGVINQDDRTIIGNPHPDFMYGISLYAGYKNWDFNVFFDGRQGNDMYNAQREMLDFPYFGFNHGRNTLDAWAVNNANSLIPALSTSDVNDQKRASTYFVEDGSYFRLKSVNIGYNFTAKADSFFKKIGLESGKVYIQAENLMTITSFTGFDYEVPGLSRTGIGIAGMGVYPHTKTYSFGLNLQF